MNGMILISISGMVLLITISSVLLAAWSVFNAWEYRKNTRILTELRMKNGTDGNHDINN